jgi:nucleotide-binding universal stress UspA family protein
MTTKTILFPTDFSDASQTAFQYAVDYARLVNGRLLIAHVQEPVMPIIGGEIAFVTPLETNPEGVKQMLQAMVPDAPNVEFAHRLLEGDPASEIVRLAKSEHADLIVLGTHGRTGIERLLLGSTAEQVLRRAPCPVLAVKEPVLEPASA